MRDERLWRFAFMKDRFNRARLMPVSALTPWAHMVLGVDICLCLSWLVQQVQGPLSQLKFSPNRNRLGSSPQKKCHALG